VLHVSRTSCKEHVVLYVHIKTVGAVICVAHASVATLLCVHDDGTKQHQSFCSTGMAKLQSRVTCGQLAAFGPRSRATTASRTPPKSPAAFHEAVQLRSSTTASQCPFPWLQIQTCVCELATSVQVDRLQKHRRCVTCQEQLLPRVPPTPSSSFECFQVPARHLSAWQRQSMKLQPGRCNAWSICQRSFR
jgi:hypothetical protein